MKTKKEAIWRTWEKSSIKKREKLQNQYPMKKFIESFYSSPEWKNFAKEYIRRNPICFSCKGKSALPHHKILISKTLLQNGFLKSLEENQLEPLCRRCHTELHIPEYAQKNYEKWFESLTPKEQDEVEENESIMDAIEEANDPQMREWNDYIAQIMERDD